MSLVNDNKVFVQNARLFFLTYPKTDKLSELEQVRKLIKEKISYVKAKIKELVISYETGKEAHDSKEYEHFHVAVRFDRRVEIKDARFWDLRGIHGHYKTVGKVRGSWRRVIEYVKKDGMYVEEVDRGIQRTEIKTNSKSGLLALLLEKLSQGDKLGGKEELKRAIETLVMREMGVDGVCLYKLWEKELLRVLEEVLGKMGKVEIYVGDRYENCRFDMPRGVESWLKEDRYKKALILRGKSGTGKTSLALSMFKNALLVSDKEDLKRLTDEHDGIVFDDFNFRKLCEQEKIHVLDLEQSRSLEVKHGSVEIKAYMARVFTTNQRLDTFLGYVTEEMIPLQLKRRLIDVLVIEDMRKEGPQTPEGLVEEGKEDLKSLIKKT